MARHATARALTPPASGGTNAADEAGRELSLAEMLVEEFKFIHGDDRWTELTERADIATFSREAGDAAAISPSSAHWTPDARVAENDDRKSEAYRKEGELLARYHAAVQGLGTDDPSGPAALCLSGGGIRSAAFALGILQGLARHDLLDKFHYLSTVSGGGYIGSWLTAWKHRRGLAAVLKGLQPRGANDLEEPEPFQRLRFNQNFLTPKVGIASADTWAAVAAFARDLILNWLVWLPLLCSLLLIPVLMQTGLMAALYRSPVIPSSVVMLRWLRDHVPGGTPSALQQLILPDQLAGILQSSRDPVSYLDLAAIILVGIAFLSSARNRPATGFHQDKQLTQTSFFYKMVAPVFLAAVCMTAAITSWIDQGWIRGSANPDPDVVFPWDVEMRLWMVAGAAVYGIVRLVTILPLDRWQVPKGEDPTWAKAKVIASEIVGWTVAGATAGLTIFAGIVASRTAFPGLFFYDHASPEFYGKAETLTAWFAVLGPPWLILAVLIAEIAYVGITSRLLTGDRDREWLARASGWYLAVALAYLVFSGVALLGWDAWEALNGYAAYPALAGSAVASIAGGLSSLTTFVRPTNTKAKLPLNTVIAAAAGVFLLISSVFLAHWTGLGLDVLRPMWTRHLSVDMTSPGRSDVACKLLSDGEHVLPEGERVAPTSDNAQSNAEEILPNGDHLLPNGESIVLNGDYIMANGQEVQIKSGRELHTLVSGQKLMCVVPAGQECWFVLAACIGLFAVSRFVSCLVNVNVFSLHALYRNRLVKTFLGASNDVLPSDRNKFDGFSLTDNLKMWKLKDPGPDAPEDPAHRNNLFHVVNMSLNVLASKNLAWQERKAEPFTCSPLHTGGARVGYRPSRTYADGIELGTAMAVSGAAVSPNWGYHSSPITSFLMMLFNVRLGWWLGNPHKASLSRETWQKDGPKSSFRLFMQEALGQTDDDQPWIYLSDGGHFENLGVYEMVRRRCRTIVVSDAGADGDFAFEDLGNAIRKVSIDLGVTIELAKIYMRERSDPPRGGAYAALGRIRYPEGRDGTFIYIKPGIYGTEPADVRAYAAANQSFPHDTTLNQWFGEAQFESYRSLGSAAIDAIHAAPRPPGHAPRQGALSTFVDQVTFYIEQYEKEFDRDGNRKK